MNTESNQSSGNRYQDSPSVEEPHPEDAISRDEPAADTAGQVARACHAAGLVVLTCGTFGNVLRFLPPLVIGEQLLEEGLSIVEDAFATL